MSTVSVCFVVFFPMVAALLLKKYHAPLLMSVVLVNTAVTLGILVTCPGETLVLMKFSGALDVAFHVDGMSRVFGAIISILWPLATLYAFNYMDHDKYKASFFRFYTATYGVTLGIAFSANLLTMYIFYEMLTLVTIPLVFHERDPKSIKAAKKYTYYSLGGASFALMGLIVAYFTCGTLDFVQGGHMAAAVGGPLSNSLLIVYVLAFMGFGVKAAVFPFHSWLPEAGVAPTPVTALLHAVAVVKAGAFGVLRLTYFIFGVEALRGTWAQYFVMAVTLAGILYGSTMSLKEPHLKRRLAYSTMSNLSYILFACTLMTPAGYLAALTHMICHAIMKICGFFNVGAVMHQTHKEFIYEIDGLGRKMPVTFVALTISGLALAGSTGLCGFVSKWYLLNAAVEEGTWLALAGIFVLLYSSLATMIYMMTISFRAFFPSKEKDLGWLEKVTDPDWRMTLPFVIFIVAMFAIGMCSNPVIALLKSILL